MLGFSEFLNEAVKKTKYTVENKDGYLIITGSNGMTYTIKDDISIVQDASGKDVRLDDAVKSEVLLSAAKFLGKSPTVSFLDHVGMAVIKESLRYDIIKPCIFKKKTCYDFLQMSPQRKYESLSIQKSVDLHYAGVLRTDKGIFCYNWERADTVVQLIQITDPDNFNKEYDIETVKRHKRSIKPAGWANSKI